MDSMIRLFCGCCGIQPSNPSDPPYRPLGPNDNVRQVREPPRANSAMGFDNPVHNEELFDAPDGAYRQRSPSPCPEEKHRNDLEREMAELEDIVESTQHNIIAVGQMEYEGIVDVDSREVTYKKIMQEHEKRCVAEGSRLNGVVKKETVIDFEFQPTQNPIHLPLTYDAMTATIPQAVTDRVPFACPAEQYFNRARPLGTRGPMLEEHPEPKKAGRTAPIAAAYKQKARECAQEVHNGMEALQIEHKTNLVVYLDF